MKTGCNYDISSRKCFLVNEQDFFGSLTSTGTGNKTPGNRYLGVITCGGGGGGEHFYITRSRFEL